MNSEQNFVGTDEQHPEVEEISALTEGVLPQDRTDEVRAHLFGCELCADVRDSLEEIRGLLGRLPGPPQMPADVAGRIDAALAAETLLAATSPTPGEPVERRPASTPQRRAHAAGGPARSARSGPGRGQGGGSRRRRSPAVLLALTCALVVLGFSAFFISALTSGDSGSDMGAKADRATAPVHGYTDANLEPTVRKLLTSGQDDSSAKYHRENGETSERSPLVRPSKNPVGPSLPGCVLKATGRPSEQPLATDQGVYRGKQVDVVVLPDRSDSRRVNVFLVDSSCANASPSGTGTVLLQRTVPRS
ncbi:anti-sigma factor family protein [Wenjunlia tyrosinilytica]|uniref:Zinc-finger domain-containing protein n=1 Tax=Wenjunlia tyrosinilytica TaxID=1544741 RepID=A0A917ZLF2_9ACTN|nr:hypothetical protein [Wenjunlia tyrosinilytica]GGO86234.1 hypothetical protein GCM10012280_21870 [Wenjunlia tyrosinilytica]